MKTNRTEKLKEIRDEVFKLKTSPLYSFRKENNYYPVIGEGSHFAKIIAIGEAPGLNEAKTGKPFCGASGKVLDELFNSIDLERSDVYVTNIVKDRPPSNRDPSIEEIKLYTPFLRRQIEIIQPIVLVSLGRFAMHFLLDHFLINLEKPSISKIHGQIFEADADYGKIKILPLFHPAVAVYNRNRLPELKQDFQILKKIIEES